MMQLKGRSAVVTGSTSGIGRAIAEAYAREGANVMLNGFGDAAEIERLRSRLARDHGVKVEYHGADMGRPAEIREMIGRAESAFGAIDILVNNAGIQHVAPLVEFPEDKWDAIIAVNLSAAFHATKAALPGMKRRRSGRIINIASTHGLVASPNKSAYVAAKHGIVGSPRRSLSSSPRRASAPTPSARDSCIRRWCRSRSRTGRARRAFRWSRPRATSSSLRSPPGNS